MISVPLNDLRDEMRAVARGDRRPSALPAAPLLAILSRDALQLLRSILRERPSSVAELVRISGQSQLVVSRALQVLAAHHLVRLVPDGEVLRPEAIANELRVDLATGTYQAIPVGP